MLELDPIMELDEVPEHLWSLGGGYVGARVRPDVPPLRRARLRSSSAARTSSSREDPDIAEAVAEILDEDGIEMLLETRAQSVRQEDGGGIAAHRQTDLTANAPSRARTCWSRPAVRPTRTGSTSKAAGIETDKRGFVPVDERLATNVPGVYALGDIKGGPAFTHISYDDYRDRDQPARGGRRDDADRLVPYTVFIDPQLGRVGLRETEAREQGATSRLPRCR